MNLKFIFSLFLAKLILFFLGVRGGGSALPGLLALRLNPDFLHPFANQFKRGTILISGTNGKTTTSTLIENILKKQNLKIIHNATGSNLLRGIASRLATFSNWKGEISADWGIFEVDEATLPQAIETLKPQGVIILNLFRDQLDRYGEIDATANKWKKALLTLDQYRFAILNADDPVVASLGKNLFCKTYYFGIDDPAHNQKSLTHFADSIFCPHCHQKLDFQKIWFSHLGEWSCASCQLKRPSLNAAIKRVSLAPNLSLDIDIHLNGESQKIKLKSHLWGLYNAGNLAAALLMAHILGIQSSITKKAILDFKPAFGRLEEFVIEGKKIKILLSKNPTGFTESIKTLGGKERKNLLLALNDRIADGQDVSWIYDVDFERLKEVARSIVVSGDRGEDLFLRLKHGEIIKNVVLEKNLKKAIKVGLSKIKRDETLYILPTYTAMLNIRKILIGKKLNN